jgi:hypothetical protein
MADLGASVLARLKRKSKESGKSLQLLLQLFCQEEFLRRLSRSEYANHLVLKGGMLIYTLSNFASRSTADIDFLLQQPSCCRFLNAFMLYLLSSKTFVQTSIPHSKQNRNINWYLFFHRCNHPLFSYL